ncbi:MAG: hypothetical protein QNJ72_18905 [Pleurocapsa sp. MO_226.B13]|nr:hypothetical protein [Pleurocapsa sp. MO_226.B13]
MKINWQKLTLKIIFWLSTEIIFNFIGIDDLADYSEFLMMLKVTVPPRSFYCCQINK